MILREQRARYACESRYASPMRRRFWVFDAASVIWESLLLPRIEPADPETVQEIFEDAPETALARMERAEAILGEREDEDVPEKVRRRGRLGRHLRGWARAAANFDESKDDLEPAERVAIEFARKSVMQHAAVTDDHVDELREYGHSDADIVELTAIAGTAASSRISRSRWICSAGAYPPPYPSGTRTGGSPNRRSPPAAVS